MEGAAQRPAARPPALLVRAGERSRPDPDRRPRRSRMFRPAAGRDHPTGHGRGDDEPGIAGRTPRRSSPACSPARPTSSSTCSMDRLDGRIPFEEVQDFMHAYEEAIERILGLRRGLVHAHRRRLPAHLVRLTQGVSMAAVITLEKLTKSYGSSRGIIDVDLEVERGRDLRLPRPQRGRQDDDDPDDAGPDPADLRQGLRVRRSSRRPIRSRSTGGSATSRASSRSTTA